MAPNSPLDRITAAIGSFSLIETGKDKRIVIACSGGADSIFLLYVLVALRKRYGFELYPVHIDHMLRAGSGRTAKELSRYIEKKFRLKTAVYSCDVRKYAKEHGMTVEEAGRTVRRGLLERYARSKKASRIALGHNSDDQTETILFRLARGTGFKGLAGMRPVSGIYIRPLLFLSGKEIRNTARELRLHWWEDESNSSREYSRNIIRHDIVPLLEKINPRASEHIFAVSRQAWEFEDNEGSTRREKAQQAFLYGTKEYHLYRASALADDLYQSKEAIRGMYESFSGTLAGIDRRHVEDFYAGAVNASTCRMNFPNDIVFMKNFNIIVVMRKSFSFRGYSMSLKAGRQKLPDTLGSFSITKKKGMKIPPGYRIRTFMPGDRYKRKKLKETFLEERIPAFFRPILPLLAKGTEVVYFPLLDGPSFSMSQDGFFFKISFKEGALFSIIKHLMR